jgi:hypothetical protein
MRDPATSGGAWEAATSGSLQGRRRAARYRVDDERRRMGSCVERLVTGSTTSGGLHERRRMGSRDERQVTRAARYGVDDERQVTRAAAHGKPTTSGR